ncbi:hypothetical protein D0X99_20200 [Algoriphagus lacus]|uniref:Uncharacterized protein n=1 Tax=Algoriphagus lacus TaxID=2056311 RepID=A0A418PL66_9BACT|nr:hypothetical protein [Algoriphagus lacus]RIW11797.1 hypothetical protein D0X99_20200 [Algoriphagus lacus]
MEILMRWGILGWTFVVFSLLCFFRAFKIFKVVSVDPNLLEFLLICLFLFSYLQSLTSLSLEMNRFLWLGFGYLFGYKK